VGERRSYEARVTGSSPVAGTLMICHSGGMADAAGLEPVSRKGVQVQVLSVVFVRSRTVR